MAFLGIDFKWFSWDLIFVQLAIDLCYVSFVVCNVFDTCVKVAGTPLFCKINWKKKTESPTVETIEREQS